MQINLTKSLKRDKLYLPLGEITAFIEGEFMDQSNLVNKTRKDLERTWKSLLLRYVPVLTDLCNEFLQSKNAFFFLIAHIIKDMINDLELDYDSDIELLNLKTRRLFENLLILYWINRHTPRESGVFNTNLPNLRQG